MKTTLTKEILNNLQKEDNKMELEQAWDYIVEQGIATDEELELITRINGYNETSLNDVIYARTGLHNIEQLMVENNGDLDYL